MFHISFNKCNGIDTLFFPNIIGLFDAVIGMDNPI